MESVTNSQELVVWAEKSALAEAKDTFSRFDASLPNDSFYFFEEGRSDLQGFALLSARTQSQMRNLNPF